MALVVKLNAYNEHKDINFVCGLKPQAANNVPDLNLFRYKGKIHVLLAVLAKVWIGWNDPRKREVAHSCT